MQPTIGKARGRVLIQRVRDRTITYAERAELGLVHLQRSWHAKTNAFPPPLTPGERRVYAGLSAQEAILEAQKEFGVLNAEEKAPIKSFARAVAANPSHTVIFSGEKPARGSAHKKLSKKERIVTAKDFMKKQGLRCDGTLVSIKKNTR